MGILHRIAHSVRLRHRIEKWLLSPVRNWNKLTAATSFDKELHREAHRDAASYAYNNFRSALYFSSKRNLYDWLTARLKQKSGLKMEFGVYRASSLNYFAAKLPEHIWHGFDSFEGLPSDWSGGAKGRGAFSLGGRLPSVRSNVRLHPGWFHDTLPAFVKTHDEKAAFVHLDADLYESTITVLRALKPALADGSLLLFDEYFGQPDWRHNEHMALSEWLEENPVFEAVCLAYTSSGAVLFELRDKENG